MNAGGSHKQRDTETTFKLKCAIDTSSLDLPIDSAVQARCLPATPCHKASKRSLDPCWVELLVETLFRARDKSQDMCNIVVFAPWAVVTKATLVVTRKVTVGTIRKFLRERHHGVMVADRKREHNLVGHIIVHGGHLVWRLGRDEEDLTVHTIRQI